MPSTLAQSKERKGSNFATWQPCFPHRHRPPVERVGALVRLALPVRREPLELDVVELLVAVQPTYLVRLAFPEIILGRLRESHNHLSRNLSTKVLKKVANSCKSH